MALSLGSVRLFKILESNYKLYFGIYNFVISWQWDWELPKRALRFGSTYSSLNQSSARYLISPSAGYESSKMCYLKLTQAMLKGSQKSL